MISDPLEIKLSVSQGSVLGLILFLLYINDIASDDTSLLSSSKNLWNYKLVKTLIISQNGWLPTN